MLERPEKHDESRGNIYTGLIQYEVKYKVPFKVPYKVLDKELKLGGDVGIFEHTDILRHVRREANKKCPVNVIVGHL